MKLEVALHERAPSSGHEIPNSQTTPDSCTRKSTDISISSISASPRNKRAQRPKRTSRSSKASIDPPPRLPKKRSKAMPPKKKIAGVNGKSATENGPESDESLLTPHAEEREPSPQMVEPSKKRAATAANGQGGGQPKRRKGAAKKVDSEKEANASVAKADVPSDAEDDAGGSGGQSDEDDKADSLEQSASKHGKRKASSKSNATAAPQNRGSGPRKTRAKPVAIKQDGEAKASVEGQANGRRQCIRFTVEEDIKMVAVLGKIAKANMAELSTGFPTHSKLAIDYRVQKLLRSIVHD